MLKQLRALVLFSITLTNAIALDYPGTPISQAQVSSSSSSHTLENNLLKVTWSTRGNQLSAPTFFNKESQETFTPSDDLFAIATEVQMQDSERIYLGMRRDKNTIQALISGDGISWEALGSFQTNNFPAALESIRIGKTSTRGGPKDYHSPGELGICEIQEVQIISQSDELSDITSKTKHIHKSTRAGTSVEIANELITIQAHANSTAYIEYEAPGDWKLIQCKIKKGSDAGMSWGPGITLNFADGQFAIVNIRAEGQYTLFDPAGERLINKKRAASLSCDLPSSDFTIHTPVAVEKNADKKQLSATLKHIESGLFVRWQAELRNGSNYVRQNYTLATTRPLTVYGLQFIEGTAQNAQQIGSVPGSPVASDSLFFGVEMPFTSNYFGTGDFRSGFPCNLPMKKGTFYDFSSVIGVYPKGQLRRAFSYYLERERSTPYHQFLHYNCWYDLGLNPTRESFTQVIKDYYRELTKERGVVVDSFVMDDGWDDFNAGLWEYNRNKFPNGFDEVSAASRKAQSNLGVWISPLGGYSGADQRTAHAKKLGLIEDSMDLSQPGYYKWFYEFCLALMKDHGVNYYKWDKAGSGVSPHFMALIQAGRELKEYDPNLFINVTVGTWPSPFWLNHIDCTWRTGTGDVAWYGVGDKREQWLTFRDWGCYEKFVKPAPLYPLNSVMHHGLVLGRHFQGAEVAKAGAEFKNAARSYFGTGANLLELYLTPDLMTEKAWNQVAEAAKWAKQNEHILIDSHWVGGDPLKLGIYGWASWSEKKSILTLRNSSDEPRELTINMTEALEIPEGHTTRFKVTNAYPDQTYKEGPVEGNVTFKLKPFEVLCLELHPIN